MYESRTPVQMGTSSRRMLVSFTDTNGQIWPAVFYGTALAVLCNFVLNIVFGINYLTTVRRDPGFQEHKCFYPKTPNVIATLGTIFSFKLYRLFYSKFFNSYRFYIDFKYPQKIHVMYNILTVINVVFVLLPIIAIDIFGLIKYSWGD